jgi:hypothetical protein
VTWNLITENPSQPPGAGRAAQLYIRTLADNRARDTRLNRDVALNILLEMFDRDLKPADIKPRDDGTVKVFDFGLAARSHCGKQRDGVSVANDYLPLITRAADRPAPPDHTIAK